MPQYQGEVDIKKEWPNVRRMQVLGATVVPATHGGKSLKEAVDSACKYDTVSPLRFAKKGRFHYIFTYRHFAW